MPTVVGVDMAVPGKGWTGLAAVKVSPITVLDLSITKSIDDVVSFIERWAPHVVVVDAPLSLPRGKKGFRRAERWAISVLGARLLPLTMPSMQMLAYAAAELRSRILWTDMLETHPSSAARIAGAVDSASFLECIGVKALEQIRFLRRSVRRHVNDALVSAVVGALLNKGKALIYADDAFLVFPLPGICFRPTTNRGQTY